jgi:hypothetical protein
VLKLGVALMTMVVALAGVHPASAQHLRGQLRDVETDEPLAAGLVTLLSLHLTSIITAVTDGRGYWHLEVPGAGAYYVTAKRLGYQPWTAGPIAVKSGDDLSSVFHLRRLPITLAPVEVSAEAMRRYLTSTGFYDRQRADFGYYITPERIERRQAVRITDLLVGLPGVDLVSTTTGSVGPRSVQLRGSNLSQGGVCRPRVFVDGLLYARGDSRPKQQNTGPVVERSPEQEMQRLDQGVSLDDIGHPSTIAAIEVYRSATQVPVQFGGASVETLCGVIVIWTRTGGTPPER